MNKYGKISVITAALAIPLGLLSSLLMTWFLKRQNSSSINVSSEVAYLTQTLVVLVVTFGLVWLVSLTTGLVGYKKDTDSEFAKLGLITLAAVSVLSVGLIAVNGLSEKASNPQKIEQLERLFDSAE